MNAMKHLALALLIAATPIFSQAQAGDHPQAEDPKAEHPNAEHPNAEHPNAAHTDAEHMDAEHPGALGDIVAVAAEAENFKTLFRAIQAAGLTETLQGEGPFTVFAPTDEAFAKLPEGTLETLLKPENREMLVNVLTYHIVPGKVESTDLKSSMVKAVNGQELSCKVEENGVSVDQAKVLEVDIAASNGVIYAIDTVLLPAAPKANPETDAPKDHPGH